MKRAAFTICTNSYLAQAKILANSIAKFASDYDFYLFLVDELDSSITYEAINNIKFIPAKQLPIDFEELVEKYNIIELNTCIKASSFKYLFERSYEVVHYFDPDIAIFDPISNLDQNFSAQVDILLTPHILNPIEWQEGSSPNENLFLNHGLYNLGYIGIKDSLASRQFLDWWEDRTLTKGFYNTRQGLFVDQLWINYVPIFYPECTKILADPGCNMGPWNLHERKLTSKEGQYFVNQLFSLKFYHFSSYKYNAHEISANYRYTFSTNPDVKPLYDWYQAQMIEEGVQTFVGKKWAYQRDKSFFANLLKRKK